MQRDGAATRARLLAAAIDHVAAHGVGDVSLRQLAEALNTSHRMLIYHFGSRDQLLVEVVREVEQRQREALEELAASTSGTLTAIGRAMWQRLISPDLDPYERLFFEVYGQALQGQPWAVPLLDDVVDAWLGPIAQLAEEHGASADQARNTARLGIAVIRGLLLDLLATGDRQATGEAMEQFLTMQELLGDAAEQP